MRRSSPKKFSRNQMRQRFFFFRIVRHEQGEVAARQDLCGASKAAS